MPFAMLHLWVRGEWGMNPIHVSRLSYSNSGHTEQEEEKIRLLSDLFGTTEHSFDLPEELGHPYTTLLIAELNEQLAGFCWTWRSPGIRNFVCFNIEGFQAGS